MRKIKFTLCLSMCLFVSSGLFAAEQEDKKTKEQQPVIAGWLENVVLLPTDKGLSMRAKLDSGAKTSSLHAFDIKRIEKNGEEWVQFKTGSLKKDDEKTVSLELPVMREVKIKRHFSKAQERPVVELTFCLDSRVYRTQFSLVDRSKFNYPVLLGRRLLKQNILIDPSTTYTLTSSLKACKSLAKKQAKADHADEK